MQIRLVATRNFRNLKPSRITFEGPRTAFIGPNGQGKSNLLEALGLLAGLRSFRSSKLAECIRIGENNGEVFWEIQQSDGQMETVHLRLNGNRRKVGVGEQIIGRLADYVGRFPVVNCCQEDRLLLRGAPSLRRQFLDAHLSAISPDYLTALSQYQAALKQRNAALKQDDAPRSILFPFEKALAKNGMILIEVRQNHLAELESSFQQIYHQFAEKSETPSIRYSPNRLPDTLEDYLKDIETNRKRDEILGSTSHGPHRDDFQVLLNGHPADSFASDGQQRGLVIALRLAQARLWQKKTGDLPIILLDDVLNELDHARQTAFWHNVALDQQVIVTGTVLPEGPDWQEFKVFNGEIQKA